jgi:hypothetical protein
MVGVNAGDEPRALHIPREVLGAGGNTRWKDLLNGGEFDSSGKGLEFSVHPSWLSILSAKKEGTAYSTVTDCRGE